MLNSICQNLILVELNRIYIVTIHNTYSCIFVLRYIVTQYIVTPLQNSIEFKFIGYRQVVIGSRSYPMFAASLLKRAKHHRSAASFLYMFH